jgi:hypothetical protein
MALRPRANRDITRPCRAPHQPMADGGLIGGGQVPRPGEASRADNGLLCVNTRRARHWHVRRRALPRITARASWSSSPWRHRDRGNPVKDSCPLEERCVRQLTPGDTHPQAVRPGTRA